MSNRLSSSKTGDWDKSLKKTLDVVGVPFPKGFLKTKREDRNPILFASDLPPPTKAELKFIREIERTYFKTSGFLKPDEQDAFKSALDNSDALQRILKYVKCSSHSSVAAIGLVEWCSPEDGSTKGKFVCEKCRADFAKNKKLAKLCLFTEFNFRFYGY